MVTSWLKKGLVKLRSPEVFSRFMMVVLLPRTYQTPNPIKRINSSTATRAPMMDGVSE
jgi:hypothetical protein